MCKRVKSVWEPVYVNAHTHAQYTGREVLKSAVRKRVLVYSSRELHCRCKGLHRSEMSSIWCAVPIEESEQVTNDLGKVDAVRLHVMYIQL